MIGLRIMMTGLVGIVVLNLTALYSQSLILQREIDTISFIVNNDTINSPFAGGFYKVKPTLADIDGDRDLDLFLGDALGTIYFFQNTGSIAQPKYSLVTEHFAGISLVPPLPEPAPAFADIDGDTDLDLFIGWLDGTIKFYRNTGTAQSSAFSLETETFALIDAGDLATPAFGDIDKDNDLDLFLGRKDGRVDFYENKGDARNPNFQKATIFAAPIDVGDYSTPALADFDNDGDLDLFLGGGPIFTGENGKIAYYKNIGTATQASFILEDSKLSSINVGARSAPVLADIDNDNDVDLLVGEEQTGIHFYRNTNAPINPPFNPAVKHYVSLAFGSSSKPTFVDIDHDGDWDLFVGGLYGNINFFRNIGTSTRPIFKFETDNLLSGASIIYSAPSFADIEGDGDDDLFVGTTDGNIQFFRNTGTPTALTFVLETANFNNIDVDRWSVPTFADIDADGDLDLLVAEWSGNIHYYRNMGSATNPNFFLITDNYFSVEATGGFGAPAFVDIDNDHDLDLLLGNQHGKINFYRNTGTAQQANFQLESDHFASITVKTHNSPAPVDIDNDGDLDLFIGDALGSLYFYRMEGSTNQPPAFPVLSSPAQNAFINDATPAFSFNVPSDADGDQLHFKVEIDDDGNFGPGTQSYESNTDTTSFSPTPPVAQGTGQVTYTLQSALADGDWWWRVSAWDGQVYGSFSSTSRFVIDVVQPFTSGHNPARGATGVAVNTNIIAHILDIGSGVKRSAIVMKVNGNIVLPAITGGASDYILTYDPPTNFDTQQIVNVSIDAADSAGNTMATDTYAFTTAALGNSAPAAPTLVSPATNTFIIDSTPSLAFNVPSDLNGDQLHFKVEIDDDGNFGPGTQSHESRTNAAGFNPTPPVAQGAGQMTYTVQSALADGDYWWRVSAWDGQVYGNASAARRFIVDVARPFTSNHNPASGATGVALNANIVAHIQDATSGVNRSRIVMKVNGNSVALSLTGTAADYALTYDPPVDFAPQQTISVSIDAADSAGNTMATDSYSFTTSGQGNSAPAAPTLVSPAADTFTNDNIPAFAFNVPSDPNGDQLHFKVEIDDDGNFGAGTQTFESRNSTTGFSPAPPVTPGSGQASYTVQSGLADGDWWWRVSAWDGQVYGDTSTPLRFYVDTTPPQINHTAVSTAPTGTSVAIAASLSDNLGVIQSAKLYYCAGGAASFDSTNMSNTGGDNFQGTIPSSAITERGAEYYFSAQDQVGNTRTFPLANAMTRPQVIQVTNSNLAFAGPASPTQVKAYRMISVPFDLDNSSVPAVLNELGTYDDTQWRLLRWSSSSNQYLEYPNVPSFEPGTGFWLITKEAKTLNAGAGKSVTTAENFNITLPVGWSQIGNPFAFTVNWSEVIKPASIENKLVGYSGNTNTSSGYDHTRTQLVPFEGYFVNNLGPQSAVIEIPPKSASGTASKQLVDGKSALQSNEWMLQITATAETYLDKDNYLGGLQDARDEWDANDFSEAPFLADHVSLYFPHADWNAFPGNYTGDFRALNPEGGAWDFEVQTSQTSVTLALADRLNVPADWNILLLDKTNRISWNLREQEQYTFLVNTREPVHAFRVIVGKNDFVEEHDLDLVGVPQAFYLSQNYPNPFNPETQLQYEVPTTGRVKIAVYNLQGQEIQRLADEPKSAGRHITAWDGRNNEGVRVASGVYLVRMFAEKFVAVRKVLLAK